MSLTYMLFGTWYMRQLAQAALDHFVAAGSSQRRPGSPKPNGSLLEELLEPDAEP